MWAKIKLWKKKTDSWSQKDDLVVREDALQILIQRPGEKPRPLSITMRTPGDDIALAVGFMYGEGLINADSTYSGAQLDAETVLIDIQSESLQVEPIPERNFYMTSSCGVCGKASIEALKIHRSPISTSSLFDMKMVAEFYNLMAAHDSSYSLTGGCHSAGVFEFDGTVRALSEDVGRHNAVDKCCGKILLNEGSFESPSVLCLSGRSCYELIQKGVMMNCAIIISVGAPSSLAIETATEMGVTLVGFYKKSGYNIYTHPERLDTFK
ncbi:MAG TPA: formate dehydrogenase accessory sulfurtransferase FdhD [Saprospiraceae bacterium]|nr:formate dehydrogenase accessory sulfurtransferase FdhD [Saprospiraceae bacterium]